MTHRSWERFGEFAGWRVRVNGARGIPTPAVWGDRVVFGGGFGSHEVYAVFVESGEQAWELRSRDDGPTAATVIDGIGLLNTESCTLEAVDIVQGRFLWEKWLGDPLLAQPAAGDGRVLMAWPAGGTHRLGAFAARTGEPLWETDIPADIISAPVISDGQAYLTTYDGAVMCVDLATGSQLWSRSGQATSAPWVVGDEVYVADRGKRDGQRRPSAAPGGGPQQATTQDSEEPMERIVRCKAEGGFEDRGFGMKAAAYLSGNHDAARKRMFAAEDAAVGFSQAPPSAKMFFAKGLIGEERVSRAWRFQGSRPVVVDGVLFETAGDRLEATDIASGRVHWTWGEDAREIQGERRLTPPAVANGRVLVGTWDGRLVSLEAASGRVRWQVPVGAPVHWQPVMSAGCVFAGLEDGSLVGFHTGDDADDGWPMWGGGPGHNGTPGRTSDRNRAVDPRGEGGTP